MRLGRRRVILWIFAIALIAAFVAIAGFSRHGEDEFAFLDRYHPQIQRHVTAKSVSDTGAFSWTSEDCDVYCFRDEFRGPAEGEVWDYFRSHHKYVRSSAFSTNRVPVYESYESAENTAGLIFEPRPPDDSFKLVISRKKTWINRQISAAMSFLHL